MKSLLIVSILAALLLSLPASAQSLFFEDFEAGIGGWTASGGGMIWATDRSAVPWEIGASAHSTSSVNRLTRDLPVASSTRFIASWWIFDDTATRAYGEVRAVGSTQLYAAGKHSSVSMPGETFKITKYQGRVLYPSATMGWFNLDGPDSPNRSPGWHRFDVESAGNGTVRFYVDGILSRTITGANVYGVKTVGLGLGAGSTVEKAWYDGIEVSNLNANNLQLNVDDDCLFVGFGDAVALTMDVSGLTQKVNGCQAILGYSNFYLFAESGCVAPGGGPWDQLIYNSWDVASGEPGEIDTAIGVNAQGAVGTDAAGTVASILLQARDQEGVTRVVFRPDVSDVECTWLADLSNQPVLPYKVDSQDIVIDGTPPQITLTTATQNANDLLNTTVAAVQGTVSFTVAASDALSGFGQAPILWVTDSAGNPVPATYVNQFPTGVYNYTCAVSATTANGVAVVSTRATDRSGNSETDTGTILINKNQVTGQVELEGFLGTGTDPLHTRTVVFEAAGGEPKSWALPLTNSEGAVFTYVLTDVPDGTATISAKTAWNLRRVSAVTLDGNGQAGVDFVGGNLLLGGDMNNSNSVNVLDYSLMKSNWWHPGVADLNGDGDTTELDYYIMKSNWFKVGQ